ncbi:MAG: hypothetical protein V3R49_02875 [Gammaproteobacteria bacterium]
MNLHPGSLKVNSVKRFGYLALIILALSGCADEKAIRLGPQQWQDLEFFVETRPSPVRTGMNEFIVIASRDVYKPGVGLIVTMRVDKKIEPRQAIQDGFTGVYRRAVMVRNPQIDVLAVHVRWDKKNQSEGKEKETTLYFPLNQKP